MIVYGFKDGKDKRAGGWGPLLGDQGTAMTLSVKFIFLLPIRRLIPPFCAHSDSTGSGYEIGKNILKAVVDAADGRGPATILTEAVLSTLSLNQPSDLIPWTYNEKDQ